MTIPNVFLDIETIPGDTFYQKEVAANISPPGNITKPNSVAAWMAEKAPAASEAAVHNTGLMPAYNQIVCICYAIDDGPVRSFMYSDERDTVAKFFEKLASDLAPLKSAMQARFVGHNLIGFDLPCIWWACLRNNVPYSFLPHPRTTKPWETMRAFDTLYQLAGPERKGYSLGNMAKLFDLLDDAPDIDGSMVWPLWKAGDYNLIADYCANDVELTRQLFNRIWEWAP